MPIFETIDNDTNQVLSSTNYYIWLKANKIKNIHSIDTKIAYLSELGFVKGVDKISEVSHSILKSVEEVYFRDFIKPNL